MGGGYILFNLFFVPYKRERLFINGILGAMSVMFIGIWIGKQYGKISAAKMCVRL